MTRSFLPLPFDSHSFPFLYYQCIRDVLQSNHSLLIACHYWLIAENEGNHIWQASPFKKKKKNPSHCCHGWVKDDSAASLLQICDLLRGCGGRGEASRNAWTQKVSNHLQESGRWHLPVLHPLTCHTCFFLRGLVLVKEYVNVSELSLQNPRDQING